MKPLIYKTVLRSIFTAKFIKNNSLLNEVRLSRLIITIISYQYVITETSAATFLFIYTWQTPGILIFSIFFFQKCLSRSNIIVTSKHCLVYVRDCHQQRSSKLDTIAHSFNLILYSVHPQWWQPSRLENEI